MIRLEKNRRGLLITLASVALIYAIALGTARAQIVLSACKDVGDWKPVLGKDSNLAAIAKDLPGRCDSSGRLQGKSLVAALYAYAYANFVDGLPVGEVRWVRHETSFVGKIIENRECLFKLSNANTIDGEITCKKSDGTGYKFSSPSGFNISTVRGGQTINVTASDILFETTDDLMLIKLIRDKNYASGVIRGVTNLVAFSFAQLLYGAVPILSADIAVDRSVVKFRDKVPLRGEGARDWIKRISGPMLIDTRYGLSVDILSLTNFSTKALNVRSGHPADREITVEYHNGYTSIFIPMTDGENYIYYKDNRGLEFTGFIPECFEQRHQPGTIRMNSTWPPPYMGNDSSGRFSKSGPPYFPSGCGSLTTPNSALVKGIFGGDSAITVKPL